MNFKRALSLKKAKKIIFIRFFLFRSKILDWFTVQSKVPELKQWRAAWAKCTLEWKPQEKFVPVDPPWERSCFNSGTLPCTNLDNYSFYRKEMESRNYHSLKLYLIRWDLCGSELVLIPVAPFLISPDFRLAFFMQGKFDKSTKI